MWQSIKQRVGVHDWYLNKELKMTKEEWYDFVTPLLEKFFLEFPDKTPSVDRKDPNGHYEISNLRIIPLEENITRSMTLLRWFDIDSSSPIEDKVEVLTLLMKGQCEAIGLDILTFAAHINETISTLDNRQFDSKRIRMPKFVRKIIPEVL